MRRKESGKFLHRNPKEPRGVSGSRGLACHGVALAEAGKTGMANKTVPVFLLS